MSVQSMVSPLTRKLQRASRFEGLQHTHVETLSRHATSFGAREVIVSEGGRCTSLYVLVSGWACRFKIVPGFSRQIVGFLLPGDHVLSDPELSSRIDYSVCCLTRCEVAETSIDDLRTSLHESPAVWRALNREALVDQAILREWILNVGRRPAEKRMAHLFCELHARLQAVGLASVDAFLLPLTQAMLGDALGLSPAHVNRTLQSLRERGLLSFQEGRLQFAAVPKLHKFAGFNAAYLGGRAAEVASPDVDWDHSTQLGSALNA